MWLTAARRTFDEFPEKVRRHIAFALDRAADGGKADNAKPLTDTEGGAFEISVRDRSGTYRAIYVLKVGAAIWIVHTFQKKSHRGIKTPRREIELVRGRIKLLQQQNNG
jgi:phage-related protein